MVGCGDLGARIARGFIDVGAEVYALTRTPVTTLSVRWLRGDIADATSIPPLPEALDQLVYCLTPSARDEASYRRAYVEGLRNVLGSFASGNVPRVTFISSTAVYGDAAGAWVDEASTCAPAAFNGRVLLEAEQLALQSGTEALILRLGGIYGPGRDSLIRNVRAGKPMAADALQWGNRIHVDDAAAASCHLVLSRARGVFNLVDSGPTASADVMDWLATQLHLLALPRPERNGQAAGRRVSNVRLLNTGFALRHPDYRSGYSGLIAAMDG